MGTKTVAEIAAARISGRCSCLRALRHRLLLRRKAPARRSLPRKRFRYPGCPARIGRGNHGAIRRSWARLDHGTSTRTDRTHRCQPPRVPQARTGAARRSRGEGRKSIQRQAGSSDARGRIVECVSSALIGTADASSERGDDPLPGDRNRTKPRWKPSGHCRLFRSAGFPNPIRMMEVEHASAGDALARLRQITRDSKCPTTPASLTRRCSMGFANSSKTSTCTFISKTMSCFQRTLTLER